MSTKNADADFTESQLRIIKEIQRVAASLGGVTSLSENEFDEHHQLGGVTTAGYQFGSWNEAVKAAGLEPYESGGGRVRPRTSDRDLLEEIVRVHLLHGSEPSERWMTRLSMYSLRPYKTRWGSFAKAREAAYELLGRP